VLNIEIETIPHEIHRYETAGDWQYNRTNNRLLIRVSDMGNWKSEALVAVHELVEALACSAHGVSQEAVDAFDFSYKGNGEPGGDPKAPYHREHVFAERVERSLCHEMGLTWREHDKAVDDLFVYEGET
jgi:hypothetical protein